MLDYSYWIKKLNLEKHPEGGYFKEVYRANDIVSTPNRFAGDRPASTSIYFLLTTDSPSHFHRIKSDEIWHFYYGSTVTIYEIDQTGNIKQHYLGCSSENEQAGFQTYIAGENWFAAEIEKTNSYALVGCTVAPGFDFQDFEMGERENLIKIFPQHEVIITKLT